MAQKHKVVLPQDARDALRAAGVLLAFDRLALSHQREYILTIQDAESSDTRQSRIEGVVDALRKATS